MWHATMSRPPSFYRCSSFLQIIQLRRRVFAISSLPYRQLCDPALSLLRQPAYFSCQAQASTFAMPKHSGSFPTTDRRHNVGANAVSSAVLLLVLSLNVSQCGKYRWVVVLDARWNRTRLLWMWGARKNYYIYRQILKEYGGTGSYVWGAVNASASVL